MTKFANVYLSGFSLQRSQLHCVPKTGQIWCVLAQMCEYEFR